MLRDNAAQRVRPAHRDGIQEGHRYQSRATQSGSRARPSTSRFYARGSRARSSPPPPRDDARRAWNLAVDQRPAAVALPLTDSDVVEVVNFAREEGLRVAPQGTGHGAAAIASLERTILLSTRHMRGVRIDPATRRARVRAGALWADVTAPASAYGLAPLAGSSPDVGVVGYTLGGGLVVARAQVRLRVRQRARHRARHRRRRPAQGQRALRPRAVPARSAAAAATSAS